MTKLQVSFDGITDTTGYLFSLAKCFSAVLKHSKYETYAEDIIAASGFAFRMWVDGGQLCPSAMSIWEFRQQKPWFENSGLTCGYVERMWGEDAVEEERRLSAIASIRASIEAGVAPVAWDLSGGEWGIITGYDDENGLLSTLKIDGSADSIPYESLGKLEIPILSVLTVTGAAPKSRETILQDTKRLAYSHLSGAEWCDNAKGLDAYDALIAFVEEKLSADTAWNLEYYLGTYAALKWYGWKFFEKYQETQLAALYQAIYEDWKEAFDTARSKDITEASVRMQIAQLLSAAARSEKEAFMLLA